MRYKPEHKEETHQRIVETASKAFRTHGFEGVGIAKLMGELNLTHGGFYAHFADKEQLVAESLVSALQQNSEAMLVALQTGGLNALFDYYLSEIHRDNPALGCPLPALGADVVRCAPESRDAFTKKLTETFDAIAEYMPGMTKEQKNANVHFLFAAMAGAVLISRAVSDPVLSKGIVESTRQHLATLFPKEPDFS